METCKSLLTTYLLLFNLFKTLLILLPYYLFSCNFHVMNLSRIN